MAKQPLRSSGPSLADVLDAIEIDDGVLAYINSLGERGRDELVTMATAPGQYPQAVRARAVFVLGALHSRPAFERLRPLLNDPSESVRLNTIYALGALGGEEAVEPLLNLLDDPAVSPVEQAHTLHCLTGIGDEATVQRLEAWSQRVQSPELKLLVQDSTRQLRLNLKKIE